MRVAKLMEPGRFQVMEEPIPTIGRPAEVLVQVKAVGLCGTDLHVFRQGREDVRFPRVVGHELSGIVREVGSGVTRLKAGDHVVLDPVFACGACPTCLKGHPNVCRQVRCYGVQMDGGCRDYIVVDEKQLYHFDPSISFEAAALAEPFSIAANVLARAAVTEKDNVLIVGCGTIGLAVLQAAKSAGARVMAADMVDKKLELAAEMGADRTVNSGNSSLEDAVERFSPEGMDVIVDAVGSTPLLMRSLEHAAPCARIVSLTFDQRPLEIPPILITKNELSIIGSRMNCRRFPQVMEWLHAGKISAEKMVTRKYPVEEIQRAFEETIANPRDNVKTLILF